MLESILNDAKVASAKLNLLSSNQINALLLDLADRAEASSSYIVEQNGLDLAQLEPTNPMYDRLLLNSERIAAIAQDIRNVAGLPSPLGKELEQITRPNGMKISKVSVPFGVIGVVYEARPNVSLDVFSLCFKAGSVALLKGGSNAYNSNRAIVSIIKEVLKSHNIDDNAVVLLPVEREATLELLKSVGMVDLIIPRGSKGLINFVRNNALVPVIETGAGICHTYFCEHGSVEKGSAIIFNAKCRRVSVCNTLDSLVINRARLADLPQLCKKLVECNVEIFADPESYTALQGNYPSNLLLEATEESFGREFLAYRMSIKTVGSLDEAIEHISKFSSKHSEAIVTENQANAEYFQKCVDAACVYHNVSTAFTDGAQFGFGAEIGISTQKLHARGPMALPEITTYKYLISGDGQVRKG